MICLTHDPCPDCSTRLVELLADNEYGDAALWCPECGLAITTDGDGKIEEIRRPERRHPKFAGEPNPHRG